MRCWRLVKSLSISLICIVPISCTIDIDINTDAPTTSSSSVDSESPPTRTVHVSGLSTREQEGQEVFLGRWQGSLDLGNGFLDVGIDADACGSGFRVHASGDELKRNSAKVPPEIAIVRAAGILTLAKDGKEHGVTTFRPSEQFRSAYEAAYGKESTVCEALAAFAHRIEPSELSTDGTLRQTATFDELVRLRATGIDAKLAKEYAETFDKLGTEGMIDLRRNGVSPEFLKGIVSAGNNEIEVADVIALRRNGVSLDYIRELDSAGHSFTPKELIDLRRNGVPAEFVSDVSVSCEDCGTVDGLIQLRRNGVPAEFVTSAKESGYSFDVDNLVNLRRNGVSAEYLMEIAVEGMEPMSAGDIVEVRRRGLSAETVRNLRGK